MFKPPYVVFFLYITMLVIYCTIPFFVIHENNQFSYLDSEKQSDFFFFYCIYCIKHFLNLFVNAF